MVLKSFYQKVKRLHSVGLLFLFIAKKCEPLLLVHISFYSAACFQRLASMRDRLEIARLKLK